MKRTLRLFTIRPAGRAALGALLLGVALLAAGCQAPGPQLERAGEAYGAGDYARAYELARAVADRSGMWGEQAAYLAGRAAERLDRPAQARRHLERAAASRDTDLAGDALASLGLLHHREGRFRDAARALEQAAEHLDGEQRARALFHAGISHQKLDRWHHARTNLVLARAATEDAELRQRIDQQMAVSGYTIQLGAFAEPANARRAAEQAVSRATELELGSPRLVSTTDGAGRELTLVQVGRFSSFDAAQRARRELGATQSIIVPITRE